MNSKFTIKHFDDYHEIQSETQNCIELGCFPPKRTDYGYFRYFGLFYKGRKPSFNAVMEKMRRLVYVGQYQHHRTGDEIGITAKDLENEVKHHMSRDH
jgi:hypothetical protein